MLFPGTAGAVFLLFLVVAVVVVVVAFLCCFCSCCLWLGVAVVVLVVAVVSMVLLLLLYAAAVDVDVVGVAFAHAVYGWGVPVVDVACRSLLLSVDAGVAFAVHVDTKPPSPRCYRIITPKVCHTGCTVLAPL